MTTAFRPVAIVAASARGATFADGTNLGIRPLLY